MRVVGRLDFGLRIAGGTASMLRIEDAIDHRNGGRSVKQLITGGRLLTAGRLDGAYADLLLDGDTIVAVLKPGEPVTEDARRVDASDRLLMPGTGQHAHSCHGASRQGARGSLVA